MDELLTWVADQIEDGWSDYEIIVTGLLMGWTVDEIEYAILDCQE